MKQKLVIKVEMHCEKCRNKALTVAANVPGVTSVALEGDEKDHVVVTGNGINTICLLNQLNKKFKHSVTILTIEDLKKKEEEEKKKKEEEEKKKKEEEEKKKKACCALLCLPPSSCANCPVGKCEHCSKCEKFKCECKCVITCTKCEGNKCEKCEKCETPKCKCKCSKSLTQSSYVNNCPPWNYVPCNPPPYYYSSVVYESNPDNCSIM
ncbi:hypothetical protein PIB30_005794 [Stylosanthes scabra]|uniref:HMA domain-containing protein n=1 Tax=Stylosanthes scabra TaxID=79078 RepID=A0ABU6X2I7_9FABA|nr:hypothetical protein [Stylosanthes scabra]